MGLFFGPLGAIAAFALDGRSDCPQCKNKIDNGVLLCPTCRATLDWFYDNVGTEAAVARWRDERQRDFVARSVEEYRRHKEAMQRRAEFWKRLAASASFVCAIIWKVTHRVLIAPPTAFDGWLREIAGGSRGTLRLLRLGWFVLVPLTILTGVGVIAWASRAMKEPALRIEDAAGRPQAEEIEPAIDLRKPHEDQAVRLDERAAGLPAQPDDRKGHLQPDVVAAIPEPPGDANRPIAVQARAEELEDLAPLPPKNLLQGQPGDPVPQEVAEAPRPVAIDGGELDRRAAEKQDAADRKAHIRELERRIQVLMQERAALQRKARQAASESAQSDVLAARTGIPFARHSPYPYVQEADKKFSEIKKLREQLNELKRQGAVWKKPEGAARVN